MKNKANGFTLIEMVVALSLLSIATTATVPTIARNRWQKDVDGYAIKLESGLLDLKAKLGKQKTSCTLRFDHSGLNNFVPPADLVEMDKHLL